MPKASTTAAPQTAEIVSRAKGDLALIQKLKEDEKRELSSLLAGEPLDEPYWEEKAVFHNRSVSYHALEAGRALIILKRIKPHGEFERFAEDALGLSHRWCSTLMAFTRASIQISEASHGAIPINRLQDMDKKKVALLGNIAPEHAEELAAHGTIDGRTIDEYDAMPIDKLKELLRKKDSDLDKHKKRIETGERDLRELKDRFLQVGHTGIQQACRNLQASVIEAFNEFTNSIAHAAPKKSDPQGTDLLHMVATREFVLLVGDQLMGYLNEHYPAVNKCLSAEELMGVRHQFMQDDLVAPSLKDNPVGSVKPTATVQDVAADTNGRKARGK